MRIMTDLQWSSSPNSQVSAFCTQVQKAQPISDKSPSRTDHVATPQKVPQEPEKQTTNEANLEESPPPPQKKLSLAEQEAEAVRRLLDRDGGNAGFEYEDGAPEGGQRRSVKREMFRLI